MKKKITVPEIRASKGGDKVITMVQAMTILMPNL